MSRDDMKELNKPVNESSTVAADAAWERIRDKERSVRVSFDLSADRAAHIQASADAATSKPGFAALPVRGVVDFSL